MSTLTNRVRDTKRVASYEPAIDHVRSEILLPKDDDTDFQFYHRTVAEIKARGFSTGETQRDAPIGIAAGDCYISKWSNLGRDVKNLDGKVVFQGGTRNPHRAIIHWYEGKGVDTKAS